MAEESGWNRHPAPPADRGSSSHSPGLSEENDRPQRLRILLVEDNAGDVLLVREVLQHHAIASELVAHDDGESAMRVLDRIEDGDEPCPDLVLLDLNVPKHDGRAILAKLRKGQRCGSVPVIVITSSNSASDRKAAADLGANEYFCKPSDYDQFLELGRYIKRLTGTA